MDNTKYWDSITFYIPYHNNYAQLENISSFIALSRAKIFFYEWNTEKTKMMKEFTTKERWPLVTVHTFSRDEIFKELIQDARDSRKVIFLITASSNYLFGREQHKLFSIYKSLFPEVVIDVAILGHCMYGCDSCGVREHNIPLFFSRYYNRALFYSGEDMKKQYFTSDSSRKILISPSVQAKSFLNQPEIIRALIDLARKAKDSNTEFLVKLHGFCFIAQPQLGEENAEGVKIIHPLHELSEIEIAMLEVLRKNFRIVEEKHYNILPLLEVVDTVITDLDSSVAFESLYFSDTLQIVAYDWRSEDTWKDEDHQEYCKLLRLFKNATELREILQSAPKEVEKGKGRLFFEKIYGKVVGDEPEKMAIARHWFERCAVPTPQSLLDSLSHIQSSSLESSPLFVEYQNALQAATAADEGVPDIYLYLAHGLEQVPKDVAEYHEFLTIHQSQLTAMNVPSLLWRSLWRKLKDEVFDAGSVFQFASRREGQKLQLVVAAEGGLEKEGGVFLVDHAWTTLFENSRKQLRESPHLLQRLEQLLQIDSNEASDTRERVERVWKEMWKYNQTYRIQLDPKSDEDTAVWYMMDEVGSRIKHCGTSEGAQPNIRCIPFFYAQRGISYSLLWPVKRIAYGEVVTRDFLADVPVGEKTARYAREFAYFWDDVEYVTNSPASAFLKRFEQRLGEHRHRLAAIAQDRAQEHPTESNGIVEEPDAQLPLKVWSNLNTVTGHLTSPQFRLVTDDEAVEADILWFAGDLKKTPEVFAEIVQKRKSLAHTFVNQFPDEESFCQKHRLIETVQQYWGDASKSWLQDSYNLNNQLDLFIAHWRENDANIQKLKDNHWIVKPWNRSRGMEIFVTDAVAPIIRSIETGPKIVSQYISEPALYGGRKFDLRFIVLVRSLEPNHLELYVYRMFWIRCANKPFSLEDFDDYEKHFTVMNYTGFQFQQIWYTQFIAQFEKEHPDVNWEKDVQPKIYRMFRDTFAAAAHSVDKLGEIQIPGAGCAAIPRSHCRAMYGLDVMLTEKLEPRLLEVNFAPDCHRACAYDPDFFNTVFAVLFGTRWKKDVEEKKEIFAKVTPL